MLLNYRFVRSVVSCFTLLMISASINTISFAGKKSKKYINANHVHASSNLHDKMYNKRKEKRKNGNSNGSKIKCVSFFKDTKGKHHVVYSNDEKALEKYRNNLQDINSSCLILNSDKLCNVNFQNRHVVDEINEENNNSEQIIDEISEGNGNIQDLNLSLSKVSDEHSILSSEHRATMTSGNVMNESFDNANVNVNNATKVSEVLNKIENLNMGEHSSNK